MQDASAVAFDLEMKRRSGVALFNTDLSCRQTLKSTTMKLYAAQR